MDLNAYRQMYMNLQGIGNTPMNSARRVKNFIKAVAGLPGAVFKDVKRRRERLDAYQKAKEDLKNGFSFEALFKKTVNGLPDMDSHTGKQIARVGDSAIGVAQSLNEIGSTSAKIVVGGRRSDMYDGQDFENGTRHFLKAVNAARKSVRISKSMLKGTGLVLGGGAVLADKAIDKLKINMSVNRAVNNAFGSRSHRTNSHSHNTPAPTQENER